MWKRARCIVAWGLYFMKKATKQLNTTTFICMAVFWLADISPGVCVYVCIGFASHIRSKHRQIMRREQKKDSNSTDTNYTTINKRMQIVCVWLILRGGGNQCNAMKTRILYTNVRTLKYAQKNVFHLNKSWPFYCVYTKFSYYFAFHGNQQQQQQRTKWTSERVNAATDFVFILINNC